MLDMVRLILPIGAYGNVTKIDRSLGELGVPAKGYRQ